MNVRITPQEKRHNANLLIVIVTEFSAIIVAFQKYVARPCSGSYPQAPQALFDMMTRNNGAVYNFLI